MQNRTRSSTQPLRHLAYSFGVMSVLIYLAFAVWIWQITKEEIRQALAYHASMLAQSVRMTARAHEGLLRGIGSELVRFGALENPEQGRILIERMQSIDPGMAGFGLAAPDGQLLLVSGVNAGAQLPNLLQNDITKRSFERVLAGERLAMGRAYFAQFMGKWVVPLRVALRDNAGKAIAVMTAGYAITGGTTSWASVALPEGVSVRLLTDDGFVIFMNPMPALSAEQLKAVFDAPLPLDSISEQFKEGGGYIPNPRKVTTSAAQLFAASDQITELGLYAVAFVEDGYVTSRFMWMMLLPTCLMALLIVVASVAYRRASIQQRYAESKRDAAEIQLNYAASHDALTDLPNRSQLKGRIDECLSVHGRGVVMMLDLDRFKEINDTLGHHIGDIMLREVSRRLEKSIEGFPSGFVCRLGGDEFGIYSNIDRTGSITLAKAIIDQLTLPFVIDSLHLQIGASIGIAQCPEDAADENGLMRCADIAMYHAKGAGLGFAFYDRNLDMHSEESLRIGSELRDALRQRQFVIHFQPKVRLDDKQTIGYEALVRWNHPRLGLLSPARFMPQAEVSDVIHGLTLQIISLVFEEMRNRALQGEVFPVAINISPRNLLDSKFVSLVSELLGNYGVNPQYVEFELTETSLIQDPDRAASQLMELHKLGIQFSIDDFGTGYSSLSYLVKMPISTLKIDRMFVARMRTSKTDETIVRSTVQMAHSLGLKVIAEGIEEDETGELLHALGCDIGQGYFYGRPVPASEIKAVKAA